MNLIIGLTKDEIDAVILVLTKNWVEPDIQPLVLSAIAKMKRAQEMRSPNKDDRPKT